MATVATGDHRHFKVTRGVIREYIEGSSPLELHFEFNPTTITRSRSIEIAYEGEGQTGPKDFNSEAEATRVAQGATVKAESFTAKILLDATDRMNADDTDVNINGVQPEMDILYSMVEPKLQAPDGATTLAALSEDSSGAQPFPSVLLFSWGKQVLPIFLTQVQFEVKAYLPSLIPYRAEATLTMQVIQSRNKFYTAEIERMFASAQQGLGSLQGFQDSGATQ